MMARAERALPPLWLAALLLASALLSLEVIGAMILVPDVRNGAIDWEMIAEAGRRVASNGNPYDYTDPTVYAWRWSPLLAYLLPPMGLAIWTALHFVALALLRDLRMIGLFLVAWPFWVDVDLGNAMTFVAVAGVLALRGSFPAMLAFGMLAVLMPRPLMLPLLAWMLWTEPRTRIPLLTFAAVHTVAVVWAGWADDWVAVLLSSAGEHYGLFWNLAPSRIVGAWWAPIGLAVAAWLTLKGRFGLASLVASPYWLPQYFLMVLVDAAKAPQNRARPVEAAPTEATGPPLRVSS